MDDKSVDAHQTFRAEFIRGHPAYRSALVYTLPIIPISDHQQWEIKEFGAGYTVQRVTLPITFDALSYGM